MQWTIHASVDIEAPAARVWGVLVDFPRYPEWNPFTRRVRTSLESGSPVDMDVVLWTGVRPQREHIREVVPERRLSWGMHIWARWLLRGEREQRLEPLGPDRTRYVTEDRLSGLLTPFVLVLYGRSLQRGFSGLASALKTRCERV